MLVVDDEPQIRHAVRHVLEELGATVYEAATGREAVRHALSTHPDVILMDIQMPDLDGVAATKTILEEFPGAKVIILTMYRQDRYVFEAVKAGAYGYLLKDAGADDLISAIGGSVTASCSSAPSSRVRSWTSSGRSRSTRTPSTGCRS